MANVESFTGKIVGVVVAVIVVAAVAVPILTDVITDNSITGTTKTILEILPVFLVLAILMIVVRMFMNKRD